MLHVIYKQVLQLRVQLPWLPCEYFISVHNPLPILIQSTYRTWIGPIQFRSTYDPLSRYASTGILISKSQRLSQEKFHFMVCEKLLKVQLARFKMKQREIDNRPQDVNFTRETQSQRVKNYIECRKGTRQTYRRGTGNARLLQWPSSMLYQ